MNMMLVACGDTAVLVDAGVMFPEPELFGVDLVIPDLSALEPYRGRIAALVLTHGHEDHIGAVAHVIGRVDGPDLRDAVHARARRAEARGTRHRRARPAHRGRAAADGHGRPVPDRVPPRHAQHPRLPGARDPHAGRHPSSTPATSRSTRRRSTSSRPICTGFAELGAQGVLALFADSTNADRRGFTGSEREVIAGVRGDLQQRHRARSFVTTFSTSVYRLQLLVDLAEQFERRVAFVGRGMQHTSEIAQRLGYLRVPPGVQIRDAEVREHVAAGRAVPLHRLPGRAAGGPAPDRDRRPPPRQSGRRATWSCSRPGSSPATRRRSAG